MYTLQVHMSASGIVIHNMGWGCQSTNPQGIHCCKWEFCVWFAWCRFAWLLEEHNRGVKRDLHVLK